MVAEESSFLQESNNLERNRNSRGSRISKRRRKHADLVTVPGAGHAPHLDNPEFVARHILQRLDELIGLIGTDDDQEHDRSPSPVASSVCSEGDSPSVRSAGRRAQRQSRTTARYSFDHAPRLLNRTCTNDVEREARVDT